MEKQSGFAGLPDFGHVPRYAVPVAAGLAALGFAYANKEKIEPHVEYGKYLIPHKWYVGKAMREADLGWGQTLKHDLSKNIVLVCHLLSLHGQDSITGKIW